MSKIKGWEKVGKRSWVNDKKPIGVNLARFETKGWAYEVVMRGRIMERKFFRTKEKAKQGAIKYMKLHPFG